MSRLQPSINLGLSEFEFWDMTVAEIDRFNDGAIWRLKRQAQFDYSLADMIGVSVSRLFSKNVEYPSIYDVYPELFNEEIIEKQKQQKEEETRQQKSVNNFLAFAMQHNQHIRKGAENKQT